MRCIIVDDEPIACKGMKRLIDTRHELELTAVFNRASEALEWLKDNSVDLVFLDIEMPGINGIELARRISGRCMVILTTAYSEYALDGFDVEALDYLVKPIDPKRFSKAIDRAVSYKTLVDEDVADKDDRDVEFIIVRADRKYVRIKLDDILYIEALKDYVIIHQPDRKTITRMTVKSIESILPRSRFMRVNKSYIVNRGRIDAFDNNDISVGGMEISIGMPYREAVLDSLLKGC